MSFFIEVYVGSRDNKKLVAECSGYNDSDLASVSDYVFRSEEFGHEPLGIPNTKVEGYIKGHKRNQSVWSLVHKVVKEIDNETSS